MDIIKEEVVVEQVASPAETKSAKADKKNQVVWYVVGIINTLLLLRIVFYLFGARDVGFTNLLYSVTDPFVSLFKGIFSSATAGSSFFDTAALLALVVISLLGWGISEMINLVQRPAPTKG